VIASFFCFGKMGNGNLPDLGSALLQRTDSFMEGDVDVFRDHIEEEFLRYTEAERGSFPWMLAS
jgi:hypothetical protein